MRPGPTRFRVFFFLSALVILALGLRLAHLQVVEQVTWAKARRENILGGEFLFAPRGRILAKNGQVLAQDQMRYELAIHYRYFRRQHPMALLLHMDALTHWIHEEEGASLLAQRLPRGLVPVSGAGQGLVYEDELDRFFEALDRWLALPCSKLRRKGISLQAALSSMRFFSFRLLSLAVEEPQLRAFGKDYKISSRFNSWGQEQDDQPILRRFAPALTGMTGKRAEEELRTRLRRILREGQEHLQHLDHLLGQGKIRPKASVFRRLDFWHAMHERYLELWLERLEVKRLEREEEKSGEGFAAFLARILLGEDRQETPGLEERIDKLYDLEDSARPLFPGIPVPFDTIVALIIGKQERYPGFRIQERYGRSYPQGTDEKRYLGNLYPESVLQGLVPLTLGPVRTEWFDKDKKSDNKEGDLEKQGRWGQSEDLKIDDRQFENYSEYERDVAYKDNKLSRREGGAGLEKSLDGLLRGKGGLRSTVSDRLGREVGMPNLDEAVPGQDVQVTIDWDLQTAAEQHLEAVAKELGFGVHDQETRHHATAALAIIDARTGDVLCMASYPRAVQLENHGEEKWLPIWKNVCVDVPFQEGEIGSTIKPFMAVEAMIRFADPLSLVEECRGHNYLRGSNGRFSYQNRSFTISCHAHVAILSREGIENALQESCNAFFCQIGRLLGREGIESGLRRFDLFVEEKEKLDPIHGLPMLRPGFTVAQWPLNRRGIGYGVKAAPLQIARAYAGLGTGRLPGLRIVDRIDGIVQQSSSKDLQIDEQILRRVKIGLARVVIRGTARGNAWLSRVQASGKTGTAILNLSGLQPRTVVKRYRAWFSGYYPRQAPAFAFSCAFFGAKEGGGKAAARTMDAFLGRLDAHPQLIRYLPAFARSRKVR